MGYSEDARMVRVDFFKSSGKWYTTEAICWRQWKSTDDDGNIILIHDAFMKALAEHLQTHSFSSRRECVHCGQKSGGDVNAAAHCSRAPFRLAGMTAVCLEPYYEHAHPVMLKVPGESEKTDEGPIEGFACKGEGHVPSFIHVIDNTSDGEQCALDVMVGSKLVATIHVDRRNTLKMTAQLHHAVRERTKA